LHNTTQRGGWDRFVGRELAGRKIGLVGLGDIARRTARKLAAFDCRVFAFDPAADAGTAESLGVRLVGLDKLLKSCDVLSLHVPATAETRGMVDEAFLRRMKTGAVLVNTARGALVDEPALVAALDSGHLAAAAVDVYRTEPVSPGDTLLGHPKIITTPHTAAETEETYARVGLATARIVLDALTLSAAGHSRNGNGEW
jgi:D-3-phosphoglycerate dehydrogenase